ncbi:biotin/lipoyl-containing protein [Pelagovum pacificum]|uniref:Lipoyl-binding domain-containing protein n=1 Tax=Pelagovum pacificum TaxID=2588711 RepID=A0A5C5GAS1_9RHOB|nr:biotin/lipoyl-containing protein [Pelagovum pacificum]QQA41903.1 hypothetical protein I8N54_14000 [Pelagovum pacificum]TNY30657.1 hypothetical protein FHY64_18940 [Pelagovum pacificum]
MTLEEIEALAARLSDDGLAEIERETGGIRVLLKRGGAVAAPAAAPVAEVPERTVVKTAEFGVLRLVHPQRSAPEVSVGDRVEAGDYVAFVEAAGQLVPVVAETSGTVAEVLGEDGALVGYAAAVVALD